MVATRAVHFAATAIAVGSIIFRTVVATPALQPDPSTAAVFRNRTHWVSGLGLATAVISGGMWLLLQSASMSGLPLDEALTADVLSEVIKETQFGEITTVRAGIAICLAGSLAVDRQAIARWLELALALALAASLAWTGHAGSTAGAMGYVHLVSDALHLIAAAAWIGGLVSLILLLIAANRIKSPSLAYEAVERFSKLGILSVATLVLTGLINSAVLVGSFHALMVTEYGQLLLLKFTLFGGMLSLALVNRLALTPRLARPEPRAQRLLSRNSAIELALGLAILAVVGLLGTLHPAVHLVP